MPITEQTASVILAGRRQPEQRVCVFEEDLLQRGADAKVEDLRHDRPKGDLAEEVHERLHTRTLPQVPEVNETVWACERWLWRFELRAGVDAPDSRPILAE